MSQQILFIKLLISGQFLPDKDLLLPQPGAQLPLLNIVKNTGHVRGPSSQSSMAMKILFSFNTMFQYLFSLWSLVEVNQASI